MGEQVVNLVPLWGELFYISPLRVRAIGRRISWNALPQKMFSMQVNQLKSPIGFLTRPPLISEFYMPQPSVSAGNRGTSTIELFGTGFQILLMNEDSIPRKTFTMPTYLILFTVLYQHPPCFLPPFSTCVIGLVGHLEPLQEIPSLSCLLCLY